MRTDAIPLAGGAYTDESKPFSMQDTVNLRAQRTEAGGTRAPDKLQTLPGLRPFVEVTGLDGVRGAHNAEGRLLAVMGRTLYRISAAGVAIPLGTIPGMGRVQIDHNQISLGNEVLAVNGSAGYLWNSVTNAFGRVTDPGFPGGSVVKFINGYFVVIEPQGRFAQSSAPAQGLSWNTLDRFTSEVSPDRLMSAGVRGSELLLLSASSGEFFQATANAQQPFRTKRIDFKVGAAGPHATIDADNNIWWLGSDGVFYCLNGYSQFRISTRPIENAIRGLDWSRAFVNRWDTVLYWTFPDGRTWGFDFAEKEWHRRESYGLNRWRANTVTWWDERWIAGDFQAGRLWDCNLSDRYYLEGDTPYVVRRTLGVSHDNQNPVRCPRLELVMDTGQPLTEAIGFPAQPDPPTISGDAPNGLQANAYSFSYTLGSGTPPYVVTLREGTLPAGLSLSTVGAITGTPTAEADSTFTVRVTDATGLWAEVEDTIEVPAAIPAPLLVTNTDSFNGTPEALTVGAAFTVPTGSGTPVVRVTSDGIYAAFSRTSDTGAGKFSWKKWNVGTGVWDTLPNPSDMPSVGPTSISWSTSGRFLYCGVAAASPNNFIIYERDGDTLARVAQTTGIPNNGSYADWSHDDSMIAMGNGTSSAGIYVFDVSNGVVSNGRSANTGYSSARVRFSPDGTYVAAGSDNEGLFIYSIGPSALTLIDSDAAQTTWAAAGLHWTDAGIVTVATQGAGPNFINTWTFNGTVLAYGGPADTQPGTLNDSDTSPDGLYLVAARSTGSTAYVYDLTNFAAPALVETQAVDGTVATCAWGNYV